MTKASQTYLPARTLILAATEALPALALLVWMVPASHSEGWLWLRYENGFLRIGAVALTFFLCMYYYDLYDWPALRSLPVALTRLPEVLGTVCLILAGLYLAAPALRLRLAVVLLAMATLGLGVAIARQIHFTITRSGRLSQNFVVVGEGRLAAELTAIIQSRPELGIRLACTVPDAPSAARLLASAARPAASGRSPARVDGWIMASSRNREPLGEAGENGDGPNMQILDGPALYEILTGKVWLESLDSDRQQPGQAATASPLAAAAKRTLEILFSLFALLLLAPLMAMIALVIWADSGAPVVFHQRRVGQSGHLFTLYKFRTMTKGDHGRFRPAEKNDERFTRAGRWLRRTRLDELPQLWNILRGDMSFMGPRPFAWQEEREWALEIPGYTQRWNVKPGATGWAQIRRGYCSTREDNVEKLAYDLFYIKNRSFALDLWILFETTRILLKGRGAR
ncbi:MAG TPA: exopolysaccharide biosynthesis polyprenyl glycosylphosphotransferase [Candidatus Dormibacteraeota bacterium]|nr:exopolysaccharide biosynthesis polyprenyl glycosylphosphotransferase [Candidatus Dormibacteraeota bacterium]